MPRLPDTDHMCINRHSCSDILNTSYIGLFSVVDPSDWKERAVDWKRLEGGRRRSRPSLLRLLWTCLGDRDVAPMTNTIFITLVVAAVEKTMYNGSNISAKLLFHNPHLRVLELASPFWAPSRNLHVIRLQPRGDIWECDWSRVSVAIANALAGGSEQHCRSDSAQHLPLPDLL